MGLTVVTPPVYEPITLQDAKDHLRIIEDDSQDALLESLIVTARDYCETRTQRQIPAATLLLTLDSFPKRCSLVTGRANDQIIKLPNPPVSAVNSVKYLNSSGVLTTLDDSMYVVDLTSEPARIAPAANEAWPDTYPVIGAVQIEYDAGYGDSPSGESETYFPTVPDTFKSAIKLLVGHLYENREATTEQALAEVPLAVESLLNTKRVK